MFNIGTIDSHGFKRLLVSKAKIDGYVSNPKYWIYIE